MNDDELLEALGARERDAIERRAPEWDEVAHGRMSAEAAADRIRARGGADEAELERGMELFAPLPDAFDDALVDRLVGDAPGQSAEVVRLASRSASRSAWRRPALGIGLVSAAAAALVLLLVRPAPDGSTAAGAAAPLAALPGFDLALEPTRAAVRADHPGATPHVAAGDDVELLLRPASSHSVVVHAWACLQRDALRRELALQLEAGAPGSTLVARTTIPADTVPGAWTLIAVVASDRPADDPCALADAPTHRVARAALEIDAPSHAP